MNTQPLQGKVAIVTGGGRGLGAAVAELYANAGASVVITARTAVEVETLAAKLRAEGKQAIGIAASVADMEAARHIVDETLSVFGRVDLLINNAAVAHPYQRIEEVDPVAWVNAININLMGCFYMARFVLPGMLAQGSGQIVNVSSGLALNSRVGQSAYCVSKAGLEMMMRTLALETADTGVVVTSYDPGMIDTPMQEEQRELDAAALRVDTEMFHKAYREGRLRDPKFVAQGLVWLAANTGSEINGKRFSINDAEFREMLERESASW